ncbi:Mucin-16 [Manis pentadactyla]|nr:Mucin-16 [Manis pentadactyla]
MGWEGSARLGCCWRGHLLALTVSLLTCGPGVPWNAVVFAQKDPKTSGATRQPTYNILSPVSLSKPRGRCVFSRSEGLPDFPQPLKHTEAILDKRRGIEVASVGLTSSVARPLKATTYGTAETTATEEISPHVELSLAKGPDNFIPFTRPGSVATTTRARSEGAHGGTTWPPGDLTPLVTAIDLGEDRTLEVASVDITTSAVENDPPETPISGTAKTTVTMESAPGEEPGPAPAPDDSTPFASAPTGSPEMATALKIISSEGPIPETGDTVGDRWETPTATVPAETMMEPAAIPATAIASGGIGPPHLAS